MSRGKVVMALWVRKLLGHTYSIKRVYSTHEYTLHCIVSYVQWTFVKIPCIVHCLVLAPGTFNILETLE